MSPKAVDKNKKKKVILEAAMKIFAQRGFAKAKMSEIAAEAAIGKGTIYEYFRSKDQIFQEAFYFFIGDMEKAYGQILAENSEAIAKLHRIIEVTITGFLAAGEFGAILMDFWAEGIRKHEQEKFNKFFNLKEIYTTYRDLVARIIEEGISQGQFRQLDTQAAASVLLGSFDGIMLQYILDPENLDLKKIAQSISDLFISGLTK